jgi:hypothetical protein
MIDWKDYNKDKPTIPGIYLVSYQGYHFTQFIGSYWNGTKFDNTEVRFWANINWPEF